MIKKTHSIERIGRAIYPFRILGFAFFAFSICQSVQLQWQQLDSWQWIGIAICFIYPHLIYAHYRYKKEARSVEINHMAADMAVQGAMLALVNFNPITSFAYIIANSAANYALRGVKQAVKGVALALTAAVVVSYMRASTFDIPISAAQFVPAYIYLALVIHYMGYLSYVRGKALLKHRDNAVRSSQRDYLTDLYNRRTLLERLHVDALTKTEFNQPASVIMIDIDNFKRINDQYGHDAGDKAIKHVAQVLLARFRTTDIVSRWGGEEFLVVLPGEFEANARVIAEQVRLLLEETAFTYDDQLILLTATFGLSYCSDTSHIDQAIKDADRALYVGKQNGRNKVVSA